MFCRSARVIYIIVTFLLLLTTFNLLRSNERVFRRYLREKIDSSEIASLVVNPLHLLNVRVYPEVQNYDLKDWHDYKFIAYEATRTGPGENGTAMILTDPEDIRKSDELREVEGLNVYVSDKISVNRSLPDVRHEKCRSQLYLKHLPHVSVVVVFHNEHASLIKRTLHSIINRSPTELLDEIILVNDASTKEDLFEPLESYIEEQFGDRVKVLVLPKRVGLIVARMEGAKIASGEVLVFLDSHIEVNSNWLPPLLEPIAINPRVGTTPIIDLYDWLTWEYRAITTQGVRGFFAWDFDYKSKPRAKHSPTQPKPTPVMLGCAFAINRQYFWDLGAYDDQLLIWNAENYELSLKLWLCGGQLLECPCSRVAHVFRSYNKFRQLDGVDFVARNFKRIAEVWMGDWKEYLYKTDPDRYSKVDSGDLTKPMMIRSQLNCKPFDYFLRFVAPEILIFPIPRTNDIAYGVISTSVNGTVLCITDQTSKGKLCTLTECAKRKNMPRRNQYFHLSEDKGIEHANATMCFENVQLQHLKGSEYQKSRWNYNFISNQIVHSSGEYCIGADITGNLTLKSCNSNEASQKWAFGFVNKTMLY